MKFDKITLLIISMLFCITVNAGDLKVFGQEFCTGYDAGACINFHHSKVKDAKNIIGQYKYPKGRKAYDACFAQTGKSDAELAYCSMLFHKEEQTEKERLSMCEKSMLDKYWETIRDDYAMSLYMSVWKCSVR